jgi:hypothetical protein
MVVLFVMAVPASAITFWQEDFESYAAGTAIQDTAKWSGSAADGPIRINGYTETSDLGQRLDSDGLALDGNSNKEQLSGVGRVWSTSRATIPGPTTNAEAIDYTVSFDAFVERGSNSNGTGNSGFHIKYGDASEFGLSFMRANNKGWGFMNSGPGLSGVSTWEGFENGYYFGANEAVSASITLDKTTMMASASVGGHDFAPQPFDISVWNTIDQLSIFNDIANPAHADRNYGMDVDNILITANTPTDFIWKGGSGDWNQATNWTPGGNPGNGLATLNNDTAWFGEVGSGDPTSTIYTNTRVDISHIQFDHETASYFIAGPGGVNMITTAEDTPVAPAIDVANGDHTFQTPFSIGDDTTVTVASGSLTFDNQVDLAGHMLTLSGATSLNHSVVDSVGGGSIVLLSGEVSGLGTISGNVDNQSATVSPGGSGGAVTISGGAVPEPSSLALVLLAGAGFFGMVRSRNRQTVL